MLNAKVNNWAVELEMYIITYEYIQGKSNTLADTLSRFIELDPDVKLEQGKTGHEFGDMCFEEISPVTTIKVNEAWQKIFRFLNT